MERQKHDNEELKDLAPKLAGLGKERPFKAPEGYFESFQEQLMQELPAEEAGEKRSAFSRFFRVEIVAVAAILLLLVLVGRFMDKSPKESLEVKFAELTTTEALGVIDSRDLTEGQLASLVNENAMEVFTDEQELYDGFVEASPTYVDINYDEIDLKGLEEEILNED